MNDYLYGDIEEGRGERDEGRGHAPPLPARPSTPDPRPSSNGNGRGEPRNVPRDRISFPDPRAFYGWLKDHGHLALAEEIGDREDFPTKIIHWTPEQIDLATVEILARAGHR